MMTLFCTRVAPPPKARHDDLDAAAEGRSRRRCPRRRGRAWPSRFGVVGDVSDWRDPALLEQRERVRIDLDRLIQAGAR